MLTRPNRPLGMVLAHPDDAEYHGIDPPIVIATSLSTGALLP
jgi:hypothetical protein